MAMTETSPAPAPVPAALAEPGGPPPPPVTAAASAVDHKVVGTGFIGAAVVFLLVGGVLGLLLRAQLATPDGELLSTRQFGQLFTYHGIFLVFLFLLPAWIGLATAVVPLQIGATRVAFPRLQATTLWLTVAGAGLIVASPFVEGGQRVVSGWTLSDPVPAGVAGRGVDYLILGLALVLVAGILAAACTITTIVKLRAPGLTFGRLPFFTWSVLVSHSVLVLALPVLLGALVILFVDREYGGRILTGVTGDGGGNPLLWERLFWFGAYPVLWALVIPALGAASEMVAVFAGRRHAMRPQAFAALGALGALSFTAWGGEVPSLEPARGLFVVAGVAVLTPAALVVLTWLRTLREAGTEGDMAEIRRRLVSGPMLFVLGFLPVFGLGLAAGAVSAVDATGDLHTNAWAAGQRHALFFASSTLAVVAAVHYWAPKLWGFRLSAGLARLEALLLAGGALLLVASELVLGLQDMPLHTATYSSADGWQVANLGAALGGAGVGLGAVLFAFDLLAGTRRRRPDLDDPWGGHTLEWATSSPPPRHNFERLPEIRSETPLLDHREATAAGGGAA
jgi:cytochrome c oxidase subunit 1